MRPPSTTTISTVMQLAASLVRKATVSAIFRHQGKHMATGGDAQTSRFEDRLKSGMARSMEDMHSPGYTGQRDSGFLAWPSPRLGSVCQSSFRI